MKPNLLPEPERWSERAEGEDAPSVEDAIGASLRRVGAATEPSETATARWARQAMAPVARRPVVGVWSAALAATLLAAGGAVAGVAWHARVVRSAGGAPHGDPDPGARARRPAQAHRAAPPPTAPEAPLASEPPALEQPAPEQPAPEQPAPEQPAPEQARAAPTPVAAHAPARVAMTPAAAPREAPGSTLAAARAATEPPPAPAPEADDEAQLLARAFRQLRSDGDARAAMAALDERDRRFGAGALGPEAALARVEALLLLGRTAEALPVLLGIRGERAGQTPTARATRAELLARANRCGEAETDLEVLLAPGAPAATRERALYARASCRLRGGQPSAAIPDLQRYLTEYPEGRFAPAVREALAKLRRP